MKFGGARMAGGRVHFEIFVRKYPDSDWKLESATEVRTIALDAAHEVINKGLAAAARVTRETQDEDSGEFASLTILTLGVPEKRRKVRVAESTEPLCVTPQDLYTVHARDRIGKLFESWLERQGATPFELLHRPDLVEKLEASAVEITHAIQKVAVPEAHARGTDIPVMVRSFRSLADRAIERLMRDARKKALPQVTPETVGRVAASLLQEAEGAYLLSCGVAGYLAKGKSWGEKVGLLLDLAEAAPPPGAARAMTLGVLAQPLAEIVGSKRGLDEILGGGLDLGASLAAMSRLAAAEVIDKLVEIENSVAKIMPNLSPRAQRLALWLGTEDFTGARATIGQRILRELSGPRRLRPTDPSGEIDVIRGLAMALTAASGKLLPIDNVQAAFSARTRMLVTRDFVESYLGQGRTAHNEAEALIWLTENIIGGGNKREAGRWLQSLVWSLKFEREYRDSSGPVAQARLFELAKLQRAVSRCGLVEEDFRPIQTKLGEIGGLIDTDNGVIAQTLRAHAPALTRLTLLLKLASGEQGPLGPVADKARTEALKLARHDSTRSELATAPDRVDAIRDLLQHAALAA